MSFAKFINGHYSRELIWAEQVARMGEGRSGFRIFTEEGHIRKYLKEIDINVRI